jgi:Ca2+-binding RTX toxin-like protein
MGKPSRAITYTLNGTSGKDAFSLHLGQLKLNEVPKSITSGATQITLAGGDGDDIFATDTPHALTSIPVFYDGGRGNDTLDFSNSSDAVAVRLYGGSKPFSTQASIVTGFGLGSIRQVSPEFYDPNDPQKILVLYPETVETNNVRNIENVIGSAKDDYLSLGAAAGAFADGGAGNDYITGWSGADTLIGGADNDFLYGKAGIDTMTGGTGADQFQVVTLNGVDVITDFHLTEGDQLFIGWQQSTDVLPTADSWYATEWFDADGVWHDAIRADFTGGGVVLVGVPMSDAAAVMASTTTFHFVS